MKLKFRHSGKRRLAVAGSALTLGALSLAAVAFADDVSNDLDLTVDATAETMALSAGGADGSTNLYVVERKDDGKNGCNIQGTTAAVSFSVDSSNPAVATVGPSSVTFNNCGDVIQLSITPLTEGTTTISLTQTANTTSGSWDPAPATFTVNVGPGVTPPTNQDPVVDTAADDADGTEGDTLQTSGSFSDPDGDSLTLTADNTEGTFTDNGDGTWSWSLVTNDDVPGGAITVTATDPDGATATDSFTYSAANADPVLGALSFAGTGTNCDPVLQFSFSDVGTADTHDGTIDWGDGSTADSFTTSPVSQSHHYSSAGTYSIAVEVEDDDGGSDSDSTQSHTVNNIASGILQPINNTGARSAFKSGSTIPVKITVKDCDGNSVGSLSPQVSFQKVNVNNDPDGTELVSSTANPTSGTTMRYDATGQQYIYNLATKGAGAGDYQVKVTDGSFAAPITAIVSVKK